MVRMALIALTVNARERVGDSTISNTAATALSRTARTTRSPSARTRRRAYGERTDLSPQGAVRCGLLQY